MAITISEALCAGAPNSKDVPARSKIPRMQRIIAAEVESCWDASRRDRPARGRYGRRLPFLPRLRRQNSNSFGSESNLGTTRLGEAGSLSLIGEQRIIRD